MLFSSKSENANKKEPQKSHQLRFCFKCIYIYIYAKKTKAGRTKYICYLEDSQSHQAKEEQMERGPQIFLCIVGCTPPLSEEAEEPLKMGEKRKYIYKGENNAIN